MSSSVLRIRLTELEEAGLVRRTNGTGYVLTARHLWRVDTCTEPPPTANITE
jgi:DNA-binding HxlR family transcriptional regulator